MTKTTPTKKDLVEKCLNAIESILERSDESGRRDEYYYTIGLFKGMEFSGLLTFDQVKKLSTMAQSAAAIIWTPLPRDKDSRRDLVKDALGR